MSVPQSLIAALPASDQVLGESFIGEELATKILPGIRQTEDADASNEASDTRKRRIEGEERQAVKRLKETHFRDSLPTPWKASSFVEGPWKIMRKERLVREEKYKISFDTSFRSINRIKDPMRGKGWDLKYTTVSNSDDLIVKSWYHSLHLRKYRQGRLENQELCLNKSVRSRHGEAEENISMIMLSEGWQPEESRDMGLVINSRRWLSHRDHLSTNQVTQGTASKAEEESVVHCPENSQTLV
ncbi:hypothetical protein BGZ61DRAFT_486998 [Ilyonectria robusta]|uniref:uncharacterized protein n=1 Tax=Ilyonectria robusta TaxID=1079257 RepID=UPI001E8E9BC8|nr:uncharacterized protein BGZ61DRAFT_486998 [Ilyonectria robusta]KAH8654687.1 hypothetical protein BGZ61DRAFT_486998 [Ilyonectria robusta]